jgi:20S proteasome alpha/beta subunit
LEAISHAGTAIGILAKDGIVLAAERKVTSKLLEQDTSAEKLYILNEYVASFANQALEITNITAHLQQHDLCRCWYDS